jgi:hypothetical protein
MGDSIDEVFATVIEPAIGFSSVDAKRSTGDTKVAVKCHFA